MRFRRLALAALAAVLGGAALAETVPSTGGGEGPPPPPPGSIAYRPVVEAAIDDVIVPGYRALAEAASVATLCKAPGAASLDAARAGFARLVQAWSRVEMYRMGPARDANRTERLFFWPDRKGLGQRQVDGILASGDAGATDVASLRQKSVAVQGLLALEALIAGDGSAALADGPADSFRCRYAATVAAAVALTAREILDGWTAPDGFAAVMRNAGPDNPVFRAQGEVVQDLLRAMREQLQMVRELKIARVIGDTPAAATPTRAPFWRSNQAIPAIVANLEAIIDLNDRGGLAAALPKGFEWAGPSLDFELRQAIRALDAVAATGKPWPDAVRDPASHQRLAYSLIPTGSALDMLAGSYVTGLGLIAGFNSQDGD